MARPTRLLSFTLCLSALAPWASRALKGKSARFERAERAMASVATDRAAN